jgi:hypothetical protein
MFNYEIRIAAPPAPQWKTWFEGITLTGEADGVTVIATPGDDPALLHGILGRVRDLNLTLIGVKRVPAGSICDL